MIENETRQFIEDFGRAATITTYTESGSVDPNPSDSYDTITETETETAAKVRIEEPRQPGKTYELDGIETEAEVRIFVPDTYAVHEGADIEDELTGVTYRIIHVFNENNGLLVCLGVEL